MKDSNIFRMKFLPLFFFIAFWASLLGSALIMADGGLSIDIEAFFVAMLSLIIFSAVCSLIMRAYFKSVIFDNGLDGFNFFGKRRTIKWENISLVKRINFLGLSYLRVYSNTEEKPLWIPLFISNIELFMKKASIFAPNGNILKEYIENTFG